MIARRLLAAGAAACTIAWTGAAMSQQPGHTYHVPAVGIIEVGFSPGGGGEYLVLKVIDSAKNEIKVLAYSFTSAAVVAALLRAKKRGVAVSIVADHKNNVTDDRYGRARAALSALANAGCDVRTISAYPIHHDKVLIVDRQTVELGSLRIPTHRDR